MHFACDRLSRAQTHLMQDFEIIAEGSLGAKQAGGLIPEHDHAAIGWFQHVRELIHHGAKQHGKIERNSERLGDFGEGVSLTPEAWLSTVMRSRHCGTSNAESILWAQEKVNQMPRWSNERI